MKTTRFLLPPLALALAFSLFTGCDHDNDDDVKAGRDRQPLPGQSIIRFENDSTSSWNFQIDGINYGRAPSGSFASQDIAPGEHRVRLDQHRGNDVKDRRVTTRAGVTTVLRIDGFEGDFDLDVFEL